MNTGEEFLKNLEKWGTSKSPSLTTPCITDQLDLPLNLSDFELNLMRDIISAGDTKSPEDFSNFPAMGATPPVDVTQNEVVSGGKDHRPPPLVKEASPERRYKGVYQRRSGKFSAEIHTRNLEKKRLWLGTYDTAEEAAMAFDRAAFKLRGPDAVLNFPDLIGTYDLSPEKDDNNELSPWTEEGSRSPEFSKNQQLCLSSQDQPEAWEIVKDHPRWSPIPLMDAHIQPSKKLKTSDSKTCKTSLDAQICSDFKEEDEEFKALFVFSK